MMTSGAPVPTSINFNAQLRTTKSTKDAKVAKKKDAKDAKGAKGAKKDGSCSVPQRFPCLQRMRDSLLCLPLCDQTQERLSLEIEQVLLGDDGGVRQGTAGHDRCELPADEGVVVADAASAVRKMDTQLQRRGYGLAANRNGLSRCGRLIALAHALQRACFGVCQEPLAVHRPGVGGLEIAKALRVGPALIGLLLGLEMMRRVDPDAVTDELAVAALRGVVEGAVLPKEKTR